MVSEAPIVLCECDTAHTKVETVEEKPLFKRPLMEKHVVVPTRGFFEWNHPNAKKPQDEFLFTKLGKKRLYLAGIYNVFEWEGYKFLHYTILTTQPNHNRMPVLLEPEAQEAWLQGSDVDEVLKRVPFALDAREAS